MQGIFGYRSRGGMNEGVMRSVALSARLSIPHLLRSTEIQDHIIAACERDSDTFLDVIDCILYQQRGVGAGLSNLLTQGGSAWRVADDGRSLQRRVDEAAQIAANDAMSAEDTAAAELSKSWSAAFGRHPNPSDAWDHAIKAVEAVLIPAVVPRQEKPQLGHVIGGLRSQPESWQFILPGPDGTHNVQPLIAALNAIWPNPDRHANSNAQEPSAVEAECALHTAVLIVQWSRHPGFLSRRGA
jgi:hypothetical protein